jgi:hypothetical protein
MPQANSTTSMPRVTSPRASESTLPCSAVINAASFVRVGFEQRLEPEHDPRSLQRRRRGPTGKAASAAAMAWRFRRRGVRTRAAHGARRRIERRRPRDPTGLRRLARDEMTRREPGRWAPGAPAGWNSLSGSWSDGLRGVAIEARIGHQCGIAATPAARVLRPCRASRPGVRRPHER